MYFEIKFKKVNPKKQNCDFFLFLKCLFVLSGEWLFIISPSYPPHTHQKKRFQQVNSKINTKPSSSLSTNAVLSPLHLGSTTRRAFVPITILVASYVETESQSSRHPAFTVPYTSLQFSVIFEEFNHSKIEQQQQKRNKRKIYPIYLCMNQYGLKTIENTIF